MNRTELLWIFKPMYEQLRSYVYEQLEEDHDALCELLPPWDEIESTPEQTFFAWFGSKVCHHGKEPYFNAVDHQPLLVSMVAIALDLYYSQYCEEELASISPDNELIRPW